MYHDVVAPGEEDHSGFPGAAPAVYKLHWVRFAAHLDAIGAVAGYPVLHDEGAVDGWMLTFDDAGACTLAVARTLAERGWRAHFFVATALVGTPGFATASDIAAVSSLGHAVGSHSHTHPERFSALGKEGITREWRTSVDVLTEILGARVTSGSVPGGYASPDVVEAAADAGLATLFTSLPTTRSQTVGGCIVRGRYAVRHDTTAERATALAVGRGLARARQTTAWRARGVAKTVLGDAYPKVRSIILSRRGR
jgi:peptidoglycan/xylan/chitin deacetylase (PgdA/CDA1 family)